ncbi:MAG: SCP2 sterol-binding domain-containing protein [Thermoplasmata archaeon]
MKSYEILESIVKRANASDSVKSELKGASKILQFELGGDKFYLQIMESGDLSLNLGAFATPNVTIIATDEVMQDILSGKLDGTKAFFSGKIKFTGDIFLSQKLINIVKKVS